MRSAFVRFMLGWLCRVLTAAVLLFSACLIAHAQMRGPAGSGAGAPYGGGGYGGGGYGGGYRGGPMIGLPGMIGVIPRLIPRQPVEEVEDEEPPRRPVRQPEYEDEPPAYRPRPRPRPQAPSPVHRAEPAPAPRPKQATPVRESSPKVTQRPERSKPIATPAAKPQPPKPALAKAPPPPRRQAPVSAPVPAVSQPSLAGPGEVPGEVLFVLKAEVSAGSLPEILRRERLSLISTDTFTLVPVTVHRARFRDRRSVAEVVAALSRDPRVASAQANHVYALVGEAMPVLAGAQYVVGKLRLKEAHASVTGKDVTVAVIDSDVDLGHPSLQGAVTDRHDALDGGKAAAAHPHGTAIAGIVGARAQLASAAPEASLLVVRAFSGETRAGAQGTTLHVLRALDWSGKMGARVVNMSFAGSWDAALSEFLAAGTGRGVVYVAAAGNAGPTSPPLFPAADPNVIAVTATDAEDRLFPAANRGSYLCVAAPGVDILVAAPNNRYGLLSGTSMAAAQVSGVVALMLQARPDLKPAEVRAALTHSARDLGPPGPDREFGAGFADADGAVRFLTAPMAPKEPDGTMPRGASATPVSANSQP
ncbi:peptidase S8/S53 [Methylorubrum populi]|uniref:Peptidase S8/S53 n=2 Tax=Methylorubrum populi TaxID=223967 RepID=A0A169QE38_9HYPH|nr:peptidase S8/S53 [Methylorubrum populi]